VSIYPNPFNESTNIILSQPVNDGRLEIYNSLGEIITEVSVNDKTNYTISDLSSGIYFLIIKKAGSPIFMKKLIAI
jgi:hypothetical protein